MLSLNTSFNNYCGDDCYNYLGDFEMKEFTIIEYSTGDFGDSGSRIGTIKANSPEEAKIKFQKENNIKDPEIGFYGFSEKVLIPELVKEAKTAIAKQEKIKEAWGECWNKLPKEAQEKALKNNGFVSQYFEDLLTIDKRERKLFEIRPKSLQGIETNNGWIKIESENDLPKKGSNCHFILKNGFSGIFVDLDDSEYLTLRNRGTHYQPIEKPKPPIY